MRAISLATGKDWYETYFGLVLQGAVMCDMPSANSITTAFLRKNGFRRRTIPDDCPDCYTIADFCNDHPKGTFVIGTGSHLTTVIELINDGYIAPRLFELGGGANVAVHKQKPTEQSCRGLYSTGDFHSNR